MQIKTRNYLLQSMNKTDVSNLVLHFLFSGYEINQYKDSVGSLLSHFSNKITTTEKKSFIFATSSMDTLYKFKI